MHIKVSFDYLYLSVEEKYTVKERKKTRKIKIQDKFHVNQMKERVLSTE